MKIEELISALSNAVSQAHRATAENSMKEFFETHYERNTDHFESPAYAPKTIEIAIPNGKGSDGHEKIICAPTAALVSYNNLVLNEVKINLDIEISEDMEDVNALVQNSNETKHAGNLQIVFKAADESEGIARVRTHLNGMI